MSKEERNRKVGGIVTVTIHALLLILLMFWVAWQAPDPPLPVYGVEVSLGDMNPGYGSSPAENPQPTPTEETAEETQATNSEAEESEESEVESDESSETTEEVETFESEEPAVVEEPKKQVTPTPKKEETKPTSAKPSPTMEEKKEKPQATPEANQGDQKGKTGTEGNPEGKTDARATYGTPGGQGGASLDMAGWLWDFKPKPKDNSAETGRIVFEVTIDSEGEIMSITTLEKTVSPAVAKIYEEEVRRLTFHKTRDNASTAPTSTGRITFVIRNQ